MNTSKPDFSVIMPCYNSASFITDALNSIIGQTYKNWELIAIDDGSKDDTLKILNAFAQKDSRIRVFSKENGGYVSAVNLGLERISGEYFTFMGSDDRLALDLFKKTHNEKHNKTPDMIGFRTIKVVEGENIGLDEITVFSTLVYLENTNIAQFENLYSSHSAIFFMRDTSTFYRTDLLKDLRYFGKYGIDADGIFKMLFSHRAHSFMSIPVDGYLWTLRRDSVSSQKYNTEINCDRLSNWFSFYDKLRTIDVSQIARQEKKYVQLYLNNVEKMFILNSQSDKTINDLVKKCIVQLKLIIKKYKCKKVFKIPLRQKLFLSSPKTYSFIRTVKKSLHFL